ncbi:hypothetical protein BABINDRAFT_119012 [Babjeviella inositovora NRRL Y-12698]|uniref:Uncharacterized protein n=1 Tax=Babjeviella inositovora NRRL Y-12698 TaxID=984486 RepID=A0A1E3QTL6_9ASCO|nr:uncharacterized protein BABINDRAFT_119012 [Babjeviella inositovora NRRL Y-12698]ODQ81010.1 hypothetical protein BABINDRAFT_119012 [Babjeviella inositovora NRRL Y-12698]
MFEQFTITTSGLTIAALTSVMATLGLGNIQIIRDTPRSSKQSQNSTAPFAITWSSIHGNHAAAHANMNITLEELASLIVQSVPIPAGSEGAKQFVKRTDFDVQYVTWNWDNVNVDLDMVLVQDRAMTEEWRDSGAFFRQHRAWKCFTATANPNPGQGEGYDQLGRGNVVHGETYLNTYGGIDGYCNDNKDGAQCSQDGCGD